MANKKAEWMGHPILDKDHAHKLEQRSALLEFHFGYPRHEAERRALEEYRQEQHAKAAAHHLNRIKGALAVGDHDVAKQHHAMYVNHMKALGMDPNGAVPPKIQVHGESSKGSTYDFEPHGADSYVTDSGPEHKPEATELSKTEVATSPVQKPLLKFDTKRSEPVNDILAGQYRQMSPKARRQAHALLVSHARTTGKLSKEHARQYRALLHVMEESGDPMPRGGGLKLD